MDSTLATHRAGSHTATSAAAHLGLLVSLMVFFPQVWCADAYAGSKKPAQYGPGVGIDWQARVIELDAEVVLRKGSLELLACSPQTREHESILRVQAKPLHVFQAMGLIGLTPGSPMRYDKNSKRWHQPTGDSLALSVRYSVKGKTTVVPVGRWLRGVDHKSHSEKIEWVFAGSRTLESGKFGADLDGTVVCVVDFDTALITVRDLHSADNEALWLEANTEAIPPVGTRCTLVIQAAPGSVPIVHLLVDGSLRHRGKPITLTTLAGLAAESWSKRDGLAVVLELEAGVSNPSRLKILRALAKAGIEPSRIEIRALSGEATRP